MKDNKKLEPFTPIENYLIDKALCKYNFTAYEWSILIFIMRNTWGKENMEIKPSLSYRYISNGTNISRNNVVKIISRLKNDNIITQFTHENINKWYINCNYSEWKREPRASLEPNENQANREHQLTIVTNLESLATIPNENQGEPGEPGDNVFLIPTSIGYITQEYYNILIANKPKRENFNTNKEHDKALKWYEFEKGLTKPNKRDFPKEPEKYNQAIEFYNIGVKELKKHIVKSFI